ncbi:MAG: hypothetical protein COW39_10240, partial [Comamonadaceae bacterium CG17_big_fil_post_rev_8_21_14_2_50_60_13]
QDAQNAVSEGKSLNITINLPKCKSSKPDTDLDMIVNYAPDKLINVKDKMIVASFEHFTMHHPEHLGSSMYEYLTYYILPNNTMVLKSLHLSAQTKEPTCPAVTFECQLGESAKLTLK